MLLKDAILLVCEKRGEVPPPGLLQSYRERKKYPKHKVRLDVSVLVFPEKGDPERPPGVHWRTWEKMKRERALLSDTGLS